MQELSFAGCPRMGTLRESQLKHSWERIKRAARRLVDLLNQPGNPL